MASADDVRARRRECFATAVRRASRRMTQLYDGALAPSGLRSTQFSILVELAARSGPPPGLTELAGALVVDRSSLGHALRPLLRDGFVALRRGETDRRARGIVMTEAGRTKFAESLPHWQAAQQAFVSAYGRRRAEQLRATLLDLAEDDRLAALTEDAV